MVVCHGSYGKVETMGKWWSVMSVMGRREITNQ